MTDSPESWTRLRDVFERAVDLDLDERSQLLDEELGRESELRARVEHMLAVGADDDFLEPPALRSGRGPELFKPNERVGSHLEGYRILGLLGVGGMGAVYEAQQEEPERRVALKMMRTGVASGVARSRFRDEINLLARLTHPGIAKVYEAGVLVEGEGLATVETPWFAMELVEGARALTSYARENGLGLHERLELFRDVCAAVHHGHQRGVIHRDLKPANLVVDASGKPRVIDFGVAKLVDSDVASASERTLQGEIVGTLLYMSPEQIEGRVDEVDARSDVYALGAVLYELVSGRPPFKIEGLPLPEAGRVLCEDDPRPPSSHRSGLPVDLDWITAKAMAKRCDERYDSAAELAEDVRRLVADEAVSAGPPSAVYHVRKFIRRHRVWVAAAAVALLAVIAGLVGTSLALFRAVRAEEQAQLERSQALAEADKAVAVVDFLVDFLSAPDPANEGKDVRVVDVLGRAGAVYQERFADQPDVRARLAQALGVVYRGLGMPSESAAELESALDVQRSLRSEPHADTARSLRELGLVRYEMGDLDGAEQLFGEAIEMELALGSDGPGLHRSRTCLGELRLKQGRREEAEELLRSGLEGLERTLGPAHRDTLITMNAFAGVLHEQARLDEAEPIYRRALEGLREQFGEEHPDTVRLRFNLAMLLHGRGQSDEAIEICQEILALRRETLGVSHPDTLLTMSNLGAMLMMRGHLDEAAPLYAESLEAMEDVLPPGHPVLQTLSVNLGMLEKARGNLERAEELLSGVYELRAETLGSAHESTLRVLYEAARIAQLRGELDMALERCQLAVDSGSEHLGADSAFLYKCVLQLGLILTELERFEEAEAQLLRALDSYDGLSASLSELDLPRPALVALYEAWGKPELADAYRGEGDAGG